MPGSAHSLMHQQLRKIFHHFKLVTCESHVFGASGVLKPSFFENCRRGLENFHNFRFQRDSIEFIFFLFRLLHIVPSIFLHGWIGKCACNKCPDVSSSKDWFDLYVIKLCTDILPTFFQASSGIQFNWKLPTNDNS